jgi:hypothetical protein
MRKPLFFLTSYCLCQLGFSQTPIGTWQVHVPMSSFEWIGETSTNIYAANQYGVLSYDREEQSVLPLTKVSALSQTGLTSFECNAKANICIVGYENGNLDIIRGNNEISNQPAILNSQTIGDKSVYDISFLEESIWLATGVGILLLSAETGNVLEYTPVNYLGENQKILNIYPLGNSLIFNTPDHIFTTSISTLFTDPSFEIIDIPANTTRIKQFFEFNNQFYALYQTDAFLEDTLYTLQNNQFVASPYLAGSGMRHFDVSAGKLLSTQATSIIEYNSNLEAQATIFTYGSPGFDAKTARYSIYEDEIIVADKDFGGVRVTFENQYAAKKFSLNSPKSGQISSLSSIDGSIYGLPGGNEYTYNRPILQRFRDQEWVSQELVSASYQTFVNGNAITQVNDNLYVGSDRGGLAVVSQSLELLSVYDNQTSPLEDLQNNYFYFGVTGVSSDSEGNVYLAYNKSDKPLKVLLKSGTWIEIQFSDAALTQPKTGDLLLLSNGFVVMTIVDIGILVYDFNGTPEKIQDDQYRLLTSSSTEGALPSGQVVCFVEDSDNELWIGTAEGIGIIYSTSSIFTTGFDGAQKVIVNQDGYNGYLFETESVEAIAVDGANRKWIGTFGSGVFLVSQDGTNQIHSFNLDNSPLFDNKIQDIAIHPTTGEVFISSEKGLVSYRSDATKATTTLENIKVFPNPVKPGYSGNIAITNITEDAYVRICDIAGSILFEGPSLGGQAMWNGRDERGQRVNSGVYLVQVVNRDGSLGATSKIFFIQ